jgi:hypothetical protein
MLRQAARSTRTTASIELRIEWMRLDDIARGRPATTPKLHDLDELDTLRLDTSAAGLDHRAEVRRAHRAADPRPRPPPLPAPRARPRRRTPRGHPGRRRRGVAAPVVRGWSSRDDHHAAAAKIADNDVGKSAGTTRRRCWTSWPTWPPTPRTCWPPPRTTSDSLDRLLGRGLRPHRAAPAMIPDDSDRPRPPRERDDEQWGSGDDPDEGSTREEDGPGPLDVEPAWRTLEPVRAIYHDGTPDGADAGGPLAAQPRQGRARRPAAHRQLDRARRHRLRHPRELGDPLPRPARPS